VVGVASRTAAAAAAMRTADASRRGTAAPGRGSGGGTRARPRSRPSLRVARLPQQVVLEFALLLRRPQLRGLGLHVLRDCSGQPDKRLLGRGHPKRARKQSRARKAPRSTNFKKQATIKTFFFFARRCQMVERPRGCSARAPARSRTSVYDTDTKLYDTD